MNQPQAHTRERSYADNIIVGLVISTVLLSACLLVTLSLTMTAATRPNEPLVPKLGSWREVGLGIMLFSYPVCVDGATVLYAFGFGLIACWALAKHMDLRRRLNMLFTQALMLLAVNTALSLAFQERWSQIDTLFQAELWAVAVCIVGLLIVYRSGTMKTLVASKQECCLTLRNIVVLGSAVAVGWGLLWVAQEILTSASSEVLHEPIFAVLGRVLRTPAQPIQMVIICCLSYLSVLAPGVITGLGYRCSARQETAWVVIASTGVVTLPLLGQTDILFRRALWAHSLAILAVLVAALFGVWAGIRLNQHLLRCQAGG